MTLPRFFATRLFAVVGFVAMVATFLALGPPAARALPVNEFETILTAPGAATGDGFGNLVSIGGDTAVVFGRGEAFVYRLAGGVWEFETTLDSSIPDDRFIRAAVSESGESIVLGGSDAQTGGAVLAVVFERSGSTWTEAARLTPNGSPAGGAFAVAISDNTVVVSDGSGTAAYVFAATAGTWAQEAKLTSNATTNCCGTSSPRFGDKLAISGDSIVVGAPYDDGAGLRSGSATVYSRSAGVWSPQVKLQGGPLSLFGWSVAISGDTAVVGAIGDNGAAHIYRLSAGTWTEQERLTGGLEVGGVTPTFGVSVAVSGDTIIVGTNQRNDAGRVVGSAHVYALIDGDWAPERVLTASDSISENAYFGNWVGVSHGNAVVGAYGTDANTGAAYVYRLTDTSSATAFGDGVATLTGLATPGGDDATVSFRYGTDPTLATSTETPLQSIGNGRDLVHVATPVSGLTNDTTNYFQMIVSDSTGEFVGTIRSFFLGARISVEQPLSTALVDGAATIDYRRTALGGVARTRTFTVGNTGPVDLELFAVTIDGPGAADFSVSALASPSVADGDWTTFDVTFAPTVAGLRSATLHIVSNTAGDEGSFDIGLVGLGADAEVWTGPSLTVTKNAFGDPYAEANQDRLTHDVWLTRYYSGGPFNAAIETAADGTSSPRGTEWAFGSAADWQTLTFQPWDSLLGATSPQGERLVLHLVDTGIYLDLEFTEYGTGFFDSGYSYVRSTPSLEPTDVTPPETTITSHPDAESDRADTTFVFEGADDLSEATTLTFACTLDSAAPVSCTSPTLLTDLADGSHTFTVAAADEAGNVDASPATFTWTIDTPNPPSSKNDCKKGGWTTFTDDQGRSFKNQGDCVSYVSTGGKNKAGG